MKVSVKKAVNEVRSQLGVSYYSHSTVPGGFEVIS